MGVYDALIQCVDNSDRWLEFGIIEHRYKSAHPATYAQMVRRWGHLSRKKTRYSASSFLGGCLGRLATEASSRPAGTQPPPATPRALTIFPARQPYGQAGN